MPDEQLEILGVIPARGGSKGVVGKNLRVVGNLSLVGHAVRSGEDSVCLSDCIVSTDDDEIAAAAAQHGGHVPFMRPPELARDDTPTAPVLRHAIDWYETETHRSVFAVVTLQPTTPLRTAADVDHAVRLFLDHQPEADSLISVCDAAEHHPLTLYFADDPYLKPVMMGLNPTTRRQDFPPVYWRNGAIYITRRDLLYGRDRVVSDHPLAFVMPKLRSANIDEPFDLELAELMLRRAQQNGGIAS